MNLIEHLEYVVQLVECFASQAEVKGALLAMEEEARGYEHAALQQVKSANKREEDMAALNAENEKLRKTIAQFTGLAPKAGQVPSIRIASDGSVVIHYKCNPIQATAEKLAMLLNCPLTEAEAIIAQQTLKPIAHRLTRGSIKRKPCCGSDAETPQSQALAAKLAEQAEFGKQVRAEMRHGIHDPVKALRQIKLQEEIDKLKAEIAPALPQGPPGPISA